MAKHKIAGGLGFKNFRDYNIMMLSKQGWSFIVNPNSLVSRLYKPDYIRQNTLSADFIHSALGDNRVSYTRVQLK